MVNKIKTLTLVVLITAMLCVAGVGTFTLVTQGAPTTAIMQIVTPNVVHTAHTNTTVKAAAKPIVSTPKPKPTPRPTPKPTPRPTPKPTPRPTPKPTPRPTPKPTPRPTPKPTPRPAPPPHNSPVPHPRGPIHVRPPYNPNYQYFYVAPYYYYYGPAYPSQLQTAIVINDMPLAIVPNGVISASFYIYSPQSPYQNPGSAPVGVYVNGVFVGYATITQNGAQDIGGFQFQTNLASGTQIPLTIVFEGNPSYAGSIVTGYFDVTPLA